MFFSCLSYIIQGMITVSARKSALLTMRQKKCSFATDSFDSPQSSSHPFFLFQVFTTYNISSFKNDSSQSLSENAWRLFDNGNILDRNSQWSPLLGFWVAGKKTQTQYVTFTGHVISTNSLTLP